MNNKKIKSTILFLVNTVRQFIKNHRVVSGIIVLVLVIGLSMGISAIKNRNTETRYVLAQVQEGNVIVSVSGSGQVSDSNQLDVKAKVAGDIVYIGAQSGEAVKEGALILQIDSSAAERAVRDAELARDTAKLALDKINATHEQQLRGDTLNKNYEEGLSILENFYGEFFATLDSLNNIFFGTELASVSSNDNISYYARSAALYDNKFSEVPSSLHVSYDATKNLYAKSLSEYQDAKRGGTTNQALAIRDGYDLMIKTTGMIKSGRDTIQFFKDRALGTTGTFTKQSIMDSQLSSLNTYATSMDTYSQEMVVIVNAINSQLDTTDNYTFDIQSQELSLQQKENALLDAQDKLKDYFIRAPFDAVVAKMDLKKGNSVTTNDVLTTLITNQQLAEISFNEVDVANIKLGQKATMTFDAIPDLTITGKVAEIDTVGTVSQGVVSYNVKISFDTQDARVKSGMSVSADIITQANTNVLVVPNSAVVYQGNNAFVRIPADKQEGKNSVDATMGATNGSAATGALGVILSGSPKQVQVQIGVANDEYTEIISGLVQGDVVVVNIITTQKTTTTTSQQGSQSGVRIPGLSGNNGGGGTFRQQ